MSAEQNKALVRKHVEAINSRNLDAAFELVSPEFIDHGLPPGTHPGIEPTRQFFTMQFAAFPDMHASVNDLIAEGDKVVARMTVSGTNQGLFMGNPPTGKAATWSFINIYRLAGGKFVEHWVEGDTLKLMQQLGFMPPPR